MRAYSQDLRDRVIELYKREKYTKREISRILKLSYQTVYRWIKRYEESNDYSSRQHIQVGRTARFRDKERILEYLANNPDSNGIEIRDEVAHSIPMSTFYDSLSRMGITYKKKSQNTKVGSKKPGRNLWIL